MRNRGAFVSTPPRRAGLRLDRHAGLRQAARRHLPWAGMLLAPLLAASLLPVPGPTDGVFCALRRITGFACMTCGFTRAFVKMVHGDWCDALRDCPLGAILPLTVVLALSAHLAALLLRVRITWTPPFLTRRQRGLALAALAGLAVANWAYRLIRGFA
jgi:hypothetical protein